MSTSRLDCSYTIIYEQGPRAEQQDDHGAVEFKEKRRLFVIDGMGGQIGGREAAQRVKKVLSGKSTPDLQEAVVHAGDMLSRWIEEEHPDASPTEAPGAVATILQFHKTEKEAEFAQVGDTRLYRVRQGQAQQLSQDQVNEQGHPIQDFGLDNFQPSYQRLTVQHRDVFILCSDGVYGAFASDSAVLSFFQDVFEDNATIQTATRKIKAFILDKLRDNATAIVVQASYTPRDTSPPKDVKAQDASPPKDVQNTPTSSSTKVTHPSVSVSTAHALKEVWWIVLVASLLCFSLGYFVGKRTAPLSAPSSQRQENDGPL